MSHIVGAYFEPKLKFMANGCRVEAGLHLKLKIWFFARISDEEHLLWKLE